MTRDEFIKRFEELDEILLEENIHELTDYARYQVHISIESIIDAIKDNEYYEEY